MLLLRIPVQQQEIRSPTSIATSAEFRVSMDTLDWVVIDSLTNKSVEVQLMTDTHPEGVQAVDPEERGEPSFPK